MSEGTCITALNLDQEPQTELRKKMGTFDEVDLQKSYVLEQCKYDETVTIASRSRQIGRKPQTRTKTAPPTS